MNSVPQPPPMQAPVLLPSNTFYQSWSAWFRTVWASLNSGFSGTIVTAKLTGGGANGSMTFVNGKVVSQVDAT